MPYGGDGPEVTEAECWAEYHENSAHAKPHSYLDAIRTSLECSATAGPYPVPVSVPCPQQQLCPYAAAGQCHYGNTCPYLHGDLCDICRCVCWCLRRTWRRRLQRSTARTRCVLSVWRWFMRKLLPQRDASGSSLPAATHTASLASASGAAPSSLKTRSSSELITAVHTKQFENRIVS
uniref:C3H1-type domain-containing protein n=1 Tax=Hucho hucho TaxID=62062 RepID=A0A4W5JT27_9TELE